MGIQLMILVILMLRQGSYWLAALAYIMVAWFLRQFFWGSGVEWLWTLKIIFVSGFQEIFIPPIIYAFISGLVGQNGWKRNTLYLSPSILFFTASVFMRLFYADFFAEIRNDIFLFYVALVVSLNFLFLILSIRVLQEARERLIKRAFYKYGLLIIIFLPQQILSAVFSVLGTADRYGIGFLTKLSTIVDLEPFQFVIYMMFFVQGVFLIVMILSELTAFKNLQLPKKLHKEELELDTHRDIRKELEESEIFRNPALSVEEAAKSLGLTKKAFSIHLQSLTTTFNDLINSIRIEDFKKSMNMQENEKYDLVSIAKMSGFSSKATFNRVFKEKEGVTPSEFRKMNEK